MTTLSDDDLKALKKAVSSKKRIATEWASAIHDLVEDRYLSEYLTLPDLAAKAVAACQEWEAAKTELEAAEST